MIEIFEYLKGIIFIIVFITFLHELGKKVCKGSLFCENFVYGFIIYTVLQAIGGIVVQFFRLPWISYKIYMFLLLASCLIFILYKRNEWITKEKVIAHFKSYTLIYMLASIFVVLSLLNLQYQWNANNIDDAFYLNKIAMTPYLENIVDYNFATGFSYQEGLARIANTFEIETAFYTELLGISAAIFCKVFLSFFQYVLILNSVIWLFQILSKENKKEKFHIIICIIPILFFGIYQEILYNQNIFYMHDSWQFNTAIWYGSSIIRHLGFILLIIPVLKYEKISRKVVLYECGVCLMMFSKASQSIPIIVLVAISFIIQKLVIKMKANKRYGVLIVMLAFALILIPQSESTLQRKIILDGIALKNLSTIVFISASCIFFSGFFLSNAMIKKWNLWLLIIGALIFVPRINTLFLYFSFYDFVMARTTTLYFFTFIVTALFYGGILLQKAFKKNYLIYTMYALCGAVLAATPVIHIYKNVGLRHTLQVIRDNKEWIPNSTLMLGEELASIQETYPTQLKVLSPAWVMMDGTPHALAAMVRYNALDILSISAIPRFNGIDDLLYKTFTQQEQDVYEYYINGVDLDDEKLKKLLSTYDINCLVLTSKDIANHLVEAQGFILKNKVDFGVGEGGYYILLK